MKTSVASTVVLIITLIIGCVILPTYFNSLEEARDDAVRMQNAARNFVDLVIDNKNINERFIEDLNLELAACSAPCSFKIYREVRVVAPTPDGYDVTWVAAEVKEGDVLEQGDFIIIEITQDRLSIHQRIASILSGGSFGLFKTRLSGMVR